MAKKTVSVGTSGVTGGETKYQDKAYVTISDENEDVFIAVDCYEGKGKSFRPREELYIKIIIGGKVFMGTSEELKKLLF